MLHTRGMSVEMIVIRSFIRYAEFKKNFFVSVVCSRRGSDVTYNKCFLALTSLVYILHTTSFLHTYVPSKYKNLFTFVVVDCLEKNHVVRRYYAYISHDISSIRFISTTTTRISSSHNHTLRLDK